MPAIDRARARPILLDAAMGTRLIARGLNLALDDPSAWCLTHPDVVLELHRLDVEAGSDSVLTNTFNANRVWLARSGQADRATAINRAAVALARDAAGPGRLVLGSVGPTASDDPMALVVHAETLVEAGVDVLVLETHRLDQALRSLPILPQSVPLIASLFEWPEAMGEAVRRLADLGVWAIGANCVNGVESASTMARKLRSSSRLPLLLKPSTGPGGTEQESPEAFAAAVPGWLDLGVSLIGGCCGTTAEHVRAMRRAIDTRQDAS